MGGGSGSGSGVQRVLEEFVSERTIHEGEKERGTEKYRAMDYDGMGSVALCESESESERAW